MTSTVDLAIAHSMHNFSVHFQFFHDFSEITAWISDLRSVIVPGMFFIQEQHFLLQLNFKIHNSMDGSFQWNNRIKYFKNLNST